mgnify:CR=1 FL=1
MTLYIYSSETGRQVDSYTGKDNDDCEAWAATNYGNDDYFWSYQNVEVLDVES